MRIVFCIMVFFLLEACTVVGPNYVRPQNAINSKYLTPAGTVAMSEKWWEAFADSQLNYFIQHALDDNQDIKLAEARFKQARAQVNIQNSLFGPTVGMSNKIVRDQWSKNSEMLVNIPSKNITTQFTNFQIGFDASWEVDIFGRLQRLSEVSLSRRDANKAHLQELRLVIAAEVARNYIELRTWQYRLALAEDNLKIAQELLRLIRVRNKVGEATQLEVDRADADLTSYASTCANFKVGFQQNLTALGILTGIPLETLETKLRIPVPLADLPDLPATGLPSDLLKRRPDIIAAEQDLMAANAEIGASIGDLYPRFSLLGNAGWMSIHSGSLLNSASQAWSIGPTLSIPIFNHGRLRNQVKVNEAGFEAALAIYRKSILNAVSEVEASLNRVVETNEKHKTLVKTQKKLKHLAQLTEFQRQIGEMTQMEVLNAKHNLVNQEDQVFQAHVQTLTALVALYKALGGGFLAGY